jgi:hypothetical protein
MASATQFGLIHVDFDTLERIPKLSANGSGRPARQTAVVGRFAGIPRWLEERDDCRHTPESPANARARETSSSR